MNTPVSFELAKLLKEKEFDEPTKVWHQRGNGIVGCVEGQRDFFNRKGDVYTSAPTIAEVVMWLYEKYNIWISVSPVFEFNDGREDYLTIRGYQYYITVITDNKYNQEKTHADRGNKNSPTEAYEAAIKYTLKNLL